MEAIEGNRAGAHIAPVQCQTSADAAAAALSVRERRRSLFFRAEPPRIAEDPRPVKVQPPKVVTAPVEKSGMPCTASFLFVPMLAPRVIGETHEIPAPVYRIQEIGIAMCMASGVQRNEMFSPRRTKPIAQARQLAMVLCKILTNRSLPEIGRRFAGRDHTTVLHAVRKFEWMVPLLKERVPEGSHPMHWANAAWDLYLSGKPAQ